MVRITEITDKNIVWNKLNGISLEFKAEYDFLVKVLTTLIPLKSKHRNQIALGNIEDFKMRTSKFLNTTYPDSDDPDVIAVKRQVTDMLSNIDLLKSQLIF